MNCTEARAAVPALLYGDLTADEAAAVNAHLAGCAACRDEYAALQRVRGLLDAAPVPAASVDVARIYAEAARLQERRVHRWRRASFALLGLAAAVLLALALKLEVRADGQQLVIRWGPAPAPVVDSTPAPPREIIREVPAPNREDLEQVKLALALVRAVADDCDARDGRLQHRLDQVDQRLTRLQAQSNQRWSATEGYVTALYTALFSSREKGGTQ